MKKRTLRNIGLFCLLCVIAGAAIGYRMYNKPHRSAATEDAIVIPAGQLAAEYEKDEAAANKKYIGNAVQVSGTVSEVFVNQQHKPVVMLNGSAMAGVQCSLLDESPGIKKGDSIVIKGFCSGFLTDVVMDRCIIAH